MKTTNNTQATEPTNNHENAPTWQAHIVEELSDEAQAAVSGGEKVRNVYITDPDEQRKILMSIGFTGG